MVKITETIYHICQRKDWEAAQEIGGYRADSLESEGFIHCSGEDQVAEVANFIFKGMDDLVLLHIAVDKLQSELRWEESEGGEFPHIYGPIGLDAVTAVVDFAAGEDGIFRFPE
ncbi:MAG: DUF952 domain-containing protein [Anaerolineales bacterium]|jgi:uncharacterized protein (DUF952 family)